MSAGEFQRVYKESKMQTLDWYAYLGETNGAVYMRRTRVALSGGGPTERVFFTETNRLNSGFLEDMRRDSKVEPGGAANGSQPIRAETNRTSGAAGSRR
jgi:hypothetical protein